MHRFKVKTLQKLLIHIKILLVFIVLFCSHSAFGQSVPSVRFDSINKDPNAVDLGLSVMWAAYNVPDPNNSSTSYYVNHKTALKMNLTKFSVSPYWKLPDNSQISELLKLTFSYTSSSNNITYIVSGKNSCKNNTVSFPETNYYTWLRPNLLPGKFPHNAYFWSKDKGSGILEGLAYRFKAEVDNNSVIVSNDPTATTWYIPIRPVIDTVKVKIIGVVSDDPYVSITPKEQVLPKGAGFDIVADGGNCYEFVRWDDKDNNGQYYTSEIRTFRDVKKGKEYKAIFKVKKYTITADVQKENGVAHGTALVNNASTDEITCENNWQATLTATPEPCYQFKQWSVTQNGQISTIEQNDNTCQTDPTTGINTLTIKVDGPATYQAVFEKKKYSVSAYIKNGDSDAEPYWKDENLECGQYATISVPIDNCYVFQGWEGPGITGRLAAGQEADGYSCQVDNSVSPTQARLTIPNIDSNTQLNRDYTAYFSTKTTNVKATTEDNRKGTVGLSIGTDNN